MMTIHHVMASRSATTFMLLSSDTIGQNAPLGVPAEKWARVLQSARDKKTEDDRLSPSPQHKPSHVAAVTLQVRFTTPLASIGGGV